jgi:hypothetical protein
LSKYVNFLFFQFKSFINKDKGNSTYKHLCPLHAFGQHHTPFIMKSNVIRSPPKENDDDERRTKREKEGVFFSFCHNVKEREAEVREIIITENTFFFLLLSNSLFIVYALK